MEERDNLLACHRGKPFQKFIDRIAGLKVIQQCLHRDARAGEDGSASHHLRIAGYDLMLH